MIRVIVHTQDCNDATHVKNAVVVHSFRTFDIHAPEVESFLRESIGYGSRQIDGIELIPAK